MKRGHATLSSSYDHSCKSRPILCYPSLPQEDPAGMPNVIASHYTIQGPSSLYGASTFAGISSVLAVK